MRRLDPETISMVARAHEGHLYCYVATCIMGTSLWRLSIVRDRESGHYPLSEDYFMGREDEATAEADRLNREVLRIPEQFVTGLVAQSLRNRKVRNDNL